MAVSCAWARHWDLGDKQPDLARERLYRFQARLSRQESLLKRLNDYGIMLSCDIGKLLCVFALIFWGPLFLKLYFKTRAIPLRAGHWHLREMDYSIGEQRTLLVDKIANWCKLRILLCTNSASSAFSPKDSARAGNNQWDNFCHIIMTKTILYFYSHLTQLLRLLQWQE